MVYIPDVTPSRKFVTDYDRANIARLHAEGLHDLQIARRLGFSLSTVTKARHAMGLLVAQSRKARLYTAEEDAKIIEMRKAGHTYEEIAIALDRTLTGVQTRAAKAGHPVQRLETWREEDAAVLRRMNAEGATDFQISLATGRSVKAVQHYRLNNGIAKVPRPDVPIREFSREVPPPIPRNTTHDIPMRRDIRVSQKWRAAYPVADLVCEGYTDAEIAQKLGITEDEAHARWEDYKALMRPLKVNPSPFVGNHTYRT
jgi:DNA-binding CsgD family transcriptional regulator